MKTGTLFLFGTVLSMNIDQERRNTVNVIPGRNGTLEKEKLTSPLVKNILELSKIMSTLNEPQEIIGLQKLDPQVISAVYDRYFQDVYRYIYYRLGDQQVTEDITSDVFVRLLEAVKTRHGPRSSLKGWLISTASHIVADHLRRKYRRPTESLPEMMIDDFSASVSDVVEHRQETDAVRKAFNQLTSEQQHVLSLRFGDGYSLEETASLMNKKVNAIKALQFRAVASLQRLIGEVVNG